MKIFDSHAHYFDKRFEKEYEGGAAALLSTLIPSRVEAIVNVGTDIDTSRRAIEMAAKYDGMYAAVGIHPGDCHYLADPDASLAALEEMIRDPAERKKNKIVALGEIGLDYHFESYGEHPMDKGREAFFFERQLALAEKYRLPVIIHDREAHGDCFETILRHPDVVGVFHSYSGSAEMARELTRRGWYISFSGTLTFKNAARVREAALAVPRDRLLIETDCPYLAPHPLRGQMNHSGLLVHVLDTLATLWSCTPEEAAKQTSKNAKTLFLT